MLCSVCSNNKPVFTVRGDGRWRTALDHDMCQECWRNAMNSVRRKPRKRRESLIEVRTGPIQLDDIEPSEDQAKKQRRYAAGRAKKSLLDPSVERRSV